MKNCYYQVTRGKTSTTTIIPTAVLKYAKVVGGLGRVSQRLTETGKAAEIENGRGKMKREYLRYIQACVNSRWLR